MTIELRNIRKKCRFLPSNACDQPCTIAGILYRFSICSFFNSVPAYHPKRSLCFLRYICVLIKYVYVYVLVCVYIYYMFVGTLRGQMMIPAPLNQELQIIESHSLGTKCRSSGSKLSYPINSLPTSIRYHFFFRYSQELPISFSLSVFSSTHSSNSLSSYFLEHDCLQQFLKQGMLHTPIKCFLDWLDSQCLTLYLTLSTWKSFPFILISSVDVVD